MVETYQKRYEYGFYTRRCLGLVSCFEYKAPNLRRCEYFPFPACQRVMLGSRFANLGAATCQRVANNTPLPPCAHLGHYRYSLMGLDANRAVSRASAPAPHATPRFAIRLTITNESTVEETHLQALTQLCAGGGVVRHDGN